MAFDTYAVSSPTRATVHDDYSALSLVQLLVELSNSLTSCTSLKYRRGDYGLAIPTEINDVFSTDSRNIATTTTRSRRDSLTVLRKKRRRHVLNAFFDTSNLERTTTSLSSSPALLRTEMRQLLHNATQNIRQVTETHAALLRLLSSAIVPDIELLDETSQAAAFSTDLTEAELMLYIILRTSVAAAPAWQRSPVNPKYWLSPSITTMVERSAALQRTMRWSCDPDLVIEAALGVDHSRYNCFAFESSTSSCQLPEILTYYTDAANAAAVGRTSQHFESSKVVDTAAQGVLPYWCSEEQEEVRCLFARKPRRDLETKGGGEIHSSHNTPQQQQQQQQNPPATTDTSSPVGMSVTDAFRSIFKEEYPMDFPLCSFLFVALHRGIIGQQDPYLLLHLECGGKGTSPLGSMSPPSKLPFYPQLGETFDTSSNISPISIDVSPEFLVAVRSTAEDVDEVVVKSKGRSQTVFNEEERLETKNVQCSRGVIAMLQWSCESGTLFLRLHQLCCVSKQPEWRAALGQYGKSAIEGLRCLLFSLQSLVAEMGDRDGGPHCVSFKELLSAQRKLRYIAEDIMTLSDIFHVNTGSDWEASVVLGELSSATLLTTLYRRYVQRTANNKLSDIHTSPSYGSTTTADVPNRRIDVIGELFLAVLNPLNRMMAKWLHTGELEDPYDEFFVLPSHGSTECGFLVDTSSQRLPEFISIEAAEHILHAGVSLRSLRAASRHVTYCAKKEEKRLKNQSEDVDGVLQNQENMEDAMEINWLVREFMDSLLGHRPPSLFPTLPEVNLVGKDGSIAYWKTFYAACNDVLLSVKKEMESDMSENGTGASTMQFASVVQIPSLVVDADDMMKNALTSENTEEVSSGGGGDGVHTGRTKSMITTLSRMSRTTSVWHNAVSEELVHAFKGMSGEETVAKAKESAALRLEYERRVLRRKAQRRLQQWKAQRLSLNLERASSISRCVDDLMELYARALPNPGTGGRGGEKEMKHEEDEAEEESRLIPVGIFVKPLSKILLSPHSPVGESTAMNRGKMALPFASVSLNNENEEERPCEETSMAVMSQSNLPSLRRGSGSLWMNSMSFSLRSIQKSVSNNVKESHEDVHAPEMYVVADINDDEYLMKRSGPHVTDTSSRELAFAKFEETETRVQNYSVNSKAYQDACRAVAVKSLQGKEGCGRDGGGSTSAAGSGDNNTNDDDDVISHFWWTDPTADERKALFSRKGVSIVSTETSGVAHMLTAEDMRCILHCSSYYLTLGRYTASYLTYKALQVMLLGPYGVLYRLTQQFLDVCLMQSGRVADRMTELWQHMTKAAIEENEFNVSVLIAALNGAFVEEWESCVLCGGDTLQVQLALAIPDDTNAEDDGYLVENENDNEYSAGLSSRSLFQDTAFCRRTLSTSQCAGVAATPVAEENEEEELEAQKQQQQQQQQEQQGAVNYDHAVSLPENPFDFISRLTILYRTPCEGFWLFPRNAVAIYSDLFGTLLFWTSVTQLVTRVWHIGIKSGVPDAFFFCNVSRTVLSAVAQHMWFLIAGFARDYRQSLRFESGVLYSYRKLECFTSDHAVFLEQCRFAAMLTPAFARARRQVYGMVRQIEEVEQCLLRADKENADDLARVQYASPENPSKKTSSASTTMANDNAGKKKMILKRTRTSGNETTVGGNLAAYLSARRKEISSSNSSRSEELLKTKQKKTTTATAAEVKKRVEARRRSVRDIVRRRLRSFVGLTEIFVEHLTTLRDNIAEDAASMLLAQNDDTVEGNNSLQSSTRIAARAAALTSLIHVLESTQRATRDKL